MSFYDDASWVLIPEGIKEDVVYAQKPTNGLGDLQFTRASDATRTNSAGVIERTPWNLVTFSEQFDNVAWSKSAASISSNVSNAPNGTLTADKLIEDSTTATHQIFQSISLSASTNYNYSVYLKAIERFRFRIRFTGFSGAQDISVNLTTQTTTAGTLTNVGDGWFRLTWPINSGTGGGSPLVSIALQDASGNSTYLGNGTSGAFIWGAQFVEGTDAKPYFATTNRQDVPRLDYRNADGSVSTCPRLLLEPQRTNSIRNSTMVGAVAGSPGTLPTNWGSGTGGLTQTVVGIGTENGLQYIDLRFNGIANNVQLLVSFEASSQIAAANSQTWTESFYVKTISAPNPPVSYRHFIVQRSSLGVNVGLFDAAFTPTSTLARYSYTVTTNQATIAFIQPYFYAVLTNGATYDFTIRIAAPQMELGAFATTFIPTTTAAVTRLVDTPILNNGAFLPTAYPFTLFAEVDIIDTSIGYALSFSNNASSSNYFAIGYTTNIWTAECRPNGTNILATGTLSTTRGRHKAAAVFTSSTIKIYVDGVTVATAINTQSFNASINDLNVGFLRVVSDSGVRNSVFQSAVINRELTNTELAQITTL